jgi:hypothetical protein
MRVLYAGRRAALVQALRREADDFLAVDDDPGRASTSSRGSRLVPTT